MRLRTMETKFIGKSSQKKKLLEKKTYTPTPTTLHSVAGKNW
jgi:hypothetical protein